MSCDDQDLVIRQGSTFSRVVRWETPLFVYKAITGITQAGPAVVTAVGHGVPNGWRVAIVSAGGMRQINAKHNPPYDSEFHKATVTSGDTLELNDVNSAGYSVYTSGGYVQYYAPASLAGYTARMTVKDRVGGTELLSLTTANSRIALDDTAKTITLTVDAIDTAAITWTEGVYDLEMVDGSGVVTSILSGTVTVEQEVTT